MVVFPKAKINLGLHVTKKRSDGFHEIETIMYPIELHDVLEIAPSEKLSFNSWGIDIPGDPESNLCIQAYHLLAKDYKIPPLNIGLLKAIPIGAGLGGGSSDAAFLITSINKQFNLNIPDADMQSYASVLGSDCSFFIKAKPAFATGRGEILQEIDINLTGNDIVLIHPGIHISTQEAYDGIKPSKPEVDLQTMIHQPIRDWKENIKNDFEEGVFSKYPEIKKIKEELYDSGALYAAMSGSGSAVFGIFRDEPKGLDHVFKNYFFWKGKM